MGRQPRGDEPAERQLQIRLNTAEVEALDARRLPGEARSAAARRLLGLAVAATKADPYPARAAALGKLHGSVSARALERTRSVVLPEGTPPLSEGGWVVLARLWGEGTDSAVPSVAFLKQAEHVSTILGGDMFNWKPR